MTVKGVRVDLQTALGAGDGGGRLAAHHEDLGGLEMRRGKRRIQLGGGVILRKSRVGAVQRRVRVPEIQVRLEGADVRLEDPLQNGHGRGRVPALEQVEGTAEQVAILPVLGDVILRIPAARGCRDGRKGADVAEGLQPRDGGGVRLWRGLGTVAGVRRWM